MNSSPHTITLLTTLLTSLLHQTVAFIPIKTPSRRPALPTSKNTVALHASSNPVEITFPTPADAASAGIRDWPQTYHKSSWVESVSEGQIATRYVLEGNGRLSVNYYDDNGKEALREDRVYPGTLVEVDGEATLSWVVDGPMIVLTPGFEQGGTLIAVGGMFVALCIGLFIGYGGF